MFKKSFVSLSFSANKLQVLQLVSSKKKVYKFTTVDLPPGLVVNHRVQDKEALAQILKNLWKKLRLKEKAVGIVVPEFSTFIKNLNLPKLVSSELDEAVRWQAHDFLPKPVAEMSMDWRITRRVDDSDSILAVATEKEVLNGYVDAAAEAGLFPLVVEPPSLSLIRMTTKSQGGRLIIYGHYDEVILIITDGPKILGSSVVDSGARDEILKTAVQIVRHYKDIKVEKVLVGGVNLDQAMLKGLQDRLKIAVNRLSIAIGGLSAEEIQKYLIPISLQFKEPTEPSDEETINLLPEILVKKYQHKRLQVQLWSLMMIVTFLVWSSFFATVGTYIFTTQEISTLKREGGSRLNVRLEIEEARTKITEINQAAANVLKATEVSVLPQEILNLVNSARPSGVILKEYRLDLDRGGVELKGNAATRGDLISFKQALEENEEFSKVTIPISSFEVESNLEFELSFAYRPMVKLR